MIMNQKRKFYKASFSSGTIIYTILMSIILFILIPLLIVNTGLILSCGLIGGLWLIIVVIMMLMSSPYGYIVDKDRIIIRRMRKDIEIFFVDIVEICYVGHPQISTIVGSGNRGFYGWAGRHSYKGSGRAYVYSRKAKNMVQIETHERKVYFIAPSKPKRFIEEVKLGIDILSTEMEYNKNDLFELAEIETPKSSEFAKVIED